MNCFKNKVKLFLIFFSVFMLLVPNMPVSAIELTGTVGQAFTWNLTNDVMELKSIDQEWNACFYNGNCYVDGGKLDTKEIISVDNLFTGENETMIQWFSENPTNNLELRVKELNLSLSNDKYMQNITSLVINEEVKFICNNAFIGTNNLKNISVLNKNIDLTNSGIGYCFEGEVLEDVTIYGYSGSTAETYANENGFTFIALDEPISTTTTQTTQTTSTSTTATTTTITQKVNSVYNGNANNSKGSSSSSPKTGDSFPIVSALTAIGISTLSTVLFMKKRK